MKIIFYYFNNDVEVLLSRLLQPTAKSGLIGWWLKKIYCEYCFHIIIMNKSI